MKLLHEKVTTVTRFIDSFTTWYFFWLDSLILHKYDNQNAQTTYEIVLHKENQSKYAFR